MVKGLRSVEGESGAREYLASSIVWQMRGLSDRHDQIMIEFCSISSLLDHGYCSIMLDHHRVYSSILAHDRSLY